MDLESRLSTSPVKCCDCGCSCSNSYRSLSGTYLRSVKRKVDELEQGEEFLIPGFDIPQVARVEVSNERDALREMVTSQQETIQDLSLELEEERNASSSATNEAMSMILRLQREKAEIQMEARQFKRFAEEKMNHDQDEISALEDMLYKREEAMQALYCEVQSYKQRMMSYGLLEVEADGERATMTRNNSTGNGEGGFDLPMYDYPPLRCKLNENQERFEYEDDMCEDVEKYAFGETPRSRDHLKDLEFRINQLERNPGPIQPDGELANPKNMLEKVIVGHSPRQSRHRRRTSSGSASFFHVNGRELSPDSPTESPKFAKKNNSQTNNSNSRNINALSEDEDNTIDRVYTVDSVHQGFTYKGVENKPGFEVSDDYLNTPGEQLGQVDLGDPKIKKLYMRLQALEADRESMRQALISMRTDKAQLVLLKEIAQHLYKDMIPMKKMPMPVKKTSAVQRFSPMSVFKWIWSFIFWRKKARRSKYMYGTSVNNPGLLMVLDKGPRVSPWRCLSRTQL